LFLSVAFLVFVFFEKVLPDMYFTVFSAHPHFEMDLCLEQFLLQFLMDLFHIFDAIFINKTTKKRQKLVRNRVKDEIWQQGASDDVFFDLEALLGLFGAPLGRFWVDLGVPGRSKNGGSLVAPSAFFASWAPNGLWKASWDDFGWLLRGLGPFSVDFGVILNGLGDFLGRFVFFLVLFPATPDTRHNTTHTQH